MCVSLARPTVRAILLIYTDAQTTIDIIDCINDHNDGSGFFITDGHGFRSLFTESMNLWRSFLDVEITGLLTPEKSGVFKNWQ